MPGWRATGRRRGRGLAFDCIGADTSVAGPGALAAAGAFVQNGSSTLARPRELLPVCGDSRRSISGTITDIHHHVVDSVRAPNRPLCRSFERGWMAGPDRPSERPSERPTERPADRPGRSRTVRREIGAAIAAAATHPDRPYSRDHQLSPPCRGQDPTVNAPAVQRFCRCGGSLPNAMTEATTETTAEAMTDAQRSLSPRPALRVPGARRSFGEDRVDELGRERVCTLEVCLDGDLGCKSCIGFSPSLGRRRQRRR